MQQVKMHLPQINDSWWQQYRQVPWNLAPRLAHATVITNYMLNFDHYSIQTQLILYLFAATRSFSIRIP
jgi:capsular polysaccharide biosynthesis protein